MVTTYKIIPYNTEEKNEEKSVKDILDDFDKRLQALEKSNKKGGSLDGLI